MSKKTEMTAIKQKVYIQADGVLQLNAPKLIAGDSVEVVVLIKRAAKVPTGGKPKLSWRDFAGALGPGNHRSSDTESIDRDLANSYLDKHEPNQLDTEASKNFTDWRQFAGVHQGDAGPSDNDRIDADLAAEYALIHEPVK